MESENKNAPFSKTLTEKIEILELQPHIPKQTDNPGNAEEFFLSVMSMKNSDLVHFVCSREFVLRITGWGYRFSYSLTHCWSVSLYPEL